MHWRLVAGVPEEEVRRLLSVARRRRFSRREVVFHRDDPADSLHLVTKGRFAVRIITPLGDTVTVAVRGPGESFGEMALVGESARRAATVTALEDAETYAVYVDDFQRLRREHPSVDHVLIAFLAGEVRRQNQLLVEALYLPAEKRILRRVSELAGASRATVNRVLRDEHERGTIELRRGCVAVLDAEAISRRAQ